MLSAITRAAEWLKIGYIVTAALGQWHNMIDGERAISTAFDTTMIVQRTQPIPFSLRIRSAIADQQCAALMPAALRMPHQPIVIGAVCALAILAIGANIACVMGLLIGALVIGMIVVGALLFPYRVFEVRFLNDMGALAFGFDKSGIVSALCPALSLRLELTRMEVRIILATIAHVISNTLLALHAVFGEQIEGLGLRATAARLLGYNSHIGLATRLVMLPAAETARGLRIR